MWRKVGELQRAKLAANRYTETGSKGMSTSSVTRSICVQPEEEPILGGLEARS